MICIMFPQLICSSDLFKIQFDIRGYEILKNLGSFQEHIHHDLKKKKKKFAVTLKPVEGTSQTASSVTELSYRVCLNWTVVVF